MKGIVYTGLAVVLSVIAANACAIQFELSPLQSKINQLGDYASANAKKVAGYVSDKASEIKEFDYKAYAPDVSKTVNQFGGYVSTNAKKVAGYVSDKASEIAAVDYKTHASDASKTISTFVQNNPVPAAAGVAATAVAALATYKAYHAGLFGKAGSVIGSGINTVRNAVSATGQTVYSWLKNHKLVSAGVATAAIAGGAYYLNQ